MSNNAHCEGTRDGRAMKISGPGWLCVFDRGRWHAVLRLADDQLKTLREFYPAVGKSSESGKP